jgi:acyl-CoA synthetase (NDP forming)
VDIIVITLQAGRELLLKMCNELIEIDSKTSKPIVVTLSGSNEILGEGRELLKNNGVPVYDSTYRTVLALSHLVNYSRSIQKIDQQDKIKTISDRLDEEFLFDVQPETGGVWTEEKAKTVLQGLGIRVPKGILIKRKDELIDYSQDLKFPVVAKVISADILHKSDAGAVQLGIQDFNHLLESYDRMIDSARRYASHAVISGVLIEEMIAEKGLEMLIGVKTDPQFGPVIVCGLGGIFVEVFKDVSIRHAPVDFSEAKQMVSELKGYPLLSGTRGSKSMDVDAFAQALSNISHFAYEHRQKISEMDINPIVVMEEGKGIVALDGLIIWK